MDNINISRINATKKLILMKKKRFFSLLTFFVGDFPAVFHRFSTGEGLHFLVSRDRLFKLLDLELEGLVHYDLAVDRLDR